MKKFVVLGLAFAFAVGAVAPARAQVKAGPELDVNTFTTGEQSSSAVAVHRNGDFEVVWTGMAQDGSGSGVFGQRYDALGARRGAEFRVNSSTTGAQEHPGAAALFDGGFVVVWTDATLDGSGYGVFGQRFDPAGARRGAEFQVNTYTTGDQLGYGVSAGPFAFAPQIFPFASDFVVTWTSAGQDGFGQGVFARRFGADGTPHGAEFQVNTHTANDQYAPHVSSDANANFVVVWVSEFQDTSGTGIFGQQFRADGSRFGSEFLANSSHVAGDQLVPAVAKGSGFDPFAGHFTVAWSHPLGGGQYEVLARHFHSTGQPGADAFVVASPIQGPGWPGVAADPYGLFTVLWSSGPVIGDGEVFGRRTSILAPLGSPFQVNTFTTGEQSHVVAAYDEFRNLVATWTSFHDDSAESVQAQRFGGLAPRGAAVDTAATGNSDGNGVWEPCETVDVRPSWINSTGSVQSFSASLNALGPLGPVQVVDGFAVYGPIPDGAQGTCADCYTLQHPCVSGRTQLHADVRAEEILSTGQGQTHHRPLHLGDSFTDVPRSNLFYRFVETLLHNGVTAGCGAFQYCPASSVAREQMAVFVLVAGDPLHVPPPCTTPVFGDVPASSPFCRWIEELARRGVTSGCGGGNYCPAAAVSREEMAVFVLRTLDPTLDPPACGTPVFNDVPASSPYCRWIEELARRGVVGGCGGGNYCPASSVTREQMGAFLGVAFGLQLYGP